MILLVSCVNVINNYTYKGINYESPEQAFAAQKSELETPLNQVTPTKNPVGGSAVILLASKRHLLNNCGRISWVGSPSKLGEQLDFHANLNSNRLQFLQQAIKKRKIFDEVKTFTSDDPENASFDSDFAIILLYRSGGQMTFLKKKENPANLSRIAALSSEVSSALPPALNLILWLDNIEKTARGK
jgi:hypothetical protein